MKVLNFGSLNYDYVYMVDHAVTSGETIASLRMDTFCGGKGLNQSIALARAGVAVFQAGMVGEDGQMLIEVCEKNGVDSSCVRKISGKSGHAIIQLDKKGQNCILLYGGSNRRITEAFVDEVLNRFEKGDIILLQNEINQMALIMEKAASKGMQIVLNPSPCDENLIACDLSKVSVFLLNEIEGEQITGEKDPEKILEKMLDKFPNAKVVLTLGEGGVIYRDKNQICRQDIFKVDVVDTTAAGDTFTGYFIASMIQGLSISETLRLCAKASAIAVSRKGATDSIPSMEEVQAIDW